MLALASQPGRAFSRMDLLDAAQGEAYEGYERSVDVHIKNLRQKLGDEPRNPTYVLTVYGWATNSTNKRHETESVLETDARFHAGRRHWSA